MPIKSETELYAPVKAYLEALGYSVRSEVHHCDVVAVRGDEPPLIVELKRSFSIPLLLQAIDRLKITDTVYVAFELPAKGRAPHGASWPELRKLCGMLGLGMLAVQFYKTRRPRVEVLCHPPAASEPLYAAPRRNKRAATRLMQEFSERRADYNVGGSTRRKLVTAYREKSLQLVWLLHTQGPMSPRQLRDLTGNGKAAALLQRNVYLWFQRVSRGVYQLTPSGVEALTAYAHVIAGFTESDFPGAAEAVKPSRNE